jgi:hypothetical protein
MFFKEISKSVLIAKPEEKKTVTMVVIGSSVTPALLTLR